MRSCNSTRCRHFAHPGDFVFKRNDKKGPKEQIVTAAPDVQVRELTDDLEFVVLACDGIWDVLTNEEVTEFVRCRIAAKMEPATVSSLVAHVLLAEAEPQHGFVSVLLADLRRAHDALPGARLSDGWPRL